MARKQRNDVLAGIFIIGSSVLFCLILFMMGSFETLFQTPSTIGVYFNNVQGLREGDPVYLLGQKIGKVERVEIVEHTETEPTRVRATLGFPERYWKYMTRDAKILIDKSITGNLTVIILGLDGEPLQPGEELVGGTTFDAVQTAQRIQSTLARVTEVVDRVGSLLERVDESGVIDEAARAIPQMLADISEAVRVVHDKSIPVATRLEEIAVLVKEILDENRDGIRTTVGNLSVSSESVREVLQNLEPTRQSVEDAMQRIASACGNVANLFERNGSYVDGLLKDLRQTAATANLLTAEIRRRPWRLLYKPEPNEMDTFDLYDAAWAYNLSATTLNLSVEELTSLSHAPGRIDPGRLEGVLQDLSASLQRQREAEEKFFAVFQARETE